MRHLRLTALLPLLLLIACDGTHPTSPTTSPAALLTPVLGAAETAVHQKNVVGAAWYDDTQFGHARQTNNTGVSARWTFIWWDATNPSNQSMIRKQTKTIAPGTTEEFSVGGFTDPCKGQRDGYKNLPDAWIPDSVTVTLGQVANYQDSGDEHLFPGVCAPPPPSTPPTPPPPPQPPPAPPIPPMCMAKGHYDFPVGVSTIAQFPASFSGVHFLPEFLPLRPMSIPIMGGVPVMVTVVTQDNHAKPEPKIQTGESTIPVVSADGINTIALPVTPDVPDTGVNPDQQVTTYGPFTFPDNMTFIGVNHGGPQPVLGDEPTNSVNIISISWTCATSYR